MTSSDNLLRRLSRTSPVVAFLVVLATLLAGLLLPGIIGALLLFVLFLAAAALTFTTWPVQNSVTRAVRVVLLVLLLAAAISKVL